jgi:L-aminopeptidase/D-esterase-like protein
LISGEGDREIGKGPVRTGVTAVFPLGKDARRGVPAGWFSLNGAGEITGIVVIDEFGMTYGPVMITNTVSIGTVRDATIKWCVSGRTDSAERFSCIVPIVTETWDGALNDTYGFHVREQHVLDAINSASSGPVEEGNVGGGTGMITYAFKGGIGTASRVLPEKQGGHTVGVLVQANHGMRHLLRVAGTPVGYEIPDLMPDRPTGVFTKRDEGKEQDGSIIIVVATDAPLAPHQLKRIARRASHGLARTGAVSGSGSGDIFLAFSTQNTVAPFGAGTELNYNAIPDERITPLFEATAQATEEAIINAMVAAETMTGADDLTVHALPHDRLKAILKKYNRLEN